MESSSPAEAESIVEVDYVEVDMPEAARNACSSCDDARARLKRAIHQVEPLLREVGAKVELRELKVGSASEAELLRVRGSPSIRIAGLDLFPQHRGDDGEERVWRWRGHEYSDPPTAMFVEALMTAPKWAVQHSSYQLPGYLSRFVKGRPA